MRIAPQLIDDFYTYGYLSLEKFLDPHEDLVPIIRECEKLIDDYANRLYTEKRIRSLYAEEPITRRLARISEDLPDASNTNWMNIYQQFYRSIFQLICNAKLHDLVDSLIGPEILVHPAENLRVVMPVTLTEVDRTIGWHQDAGSFWPEADDHAIITTWIPLVDVGSENGCLEIIPGSHRLGLLSHTALDDCVPYEMLPKTDPVSISLPVGGVLVLHNYLLHRARPNSSDTVRWSIDLRWQDPALPTGRPFYPSFIVRSQTRPDTVQTDYEQWRSRWRFALQHTRGVSFYRWGGLTSPYELAEGTGNEFSPIEG